MLSLRKVKWSMTQDTNVSYVDLQRGYSWILKTFHDRSFLVNKVNYINCIIVELSIYIHVHVSGIWIDHKFYIRRCKHQFFNDSLNRMHLMHTEHQ